MEKRKSIKDMIPSYIEGIVWDNDYRTAYDDMMKYSKHYYEKHHESALLINRILNNDNLTIKCDHFYKESEFLNGRTGYIEFFKKKIEDILENTWSCVPFDDEDMKIEKNDNKVEVGINVCTWDRCHSCGQVRFKKLIFDLNNMEVEFFGCEKTCYETDTLATKIEIKNQLTITNILNTNDILDDLKYDINCKQGISQLVDDFAKKNIGYVQTGNMDMRVYKNKQSNALAIVWPSPKKETMEFLKDFEKVGIISCDVWRVMFADLKETGARIMDSDRQCFDVNMEVGTYSVTTDISRSKDIAVLIELEGK